MPKPPLVNKDMNIPPPKKTKTRKLSGANPNLTTLNTSFAVPLNPCDRYMFTPMNINISDVTKHSNMNCWECGKPIHLIGHYRYVKYYVQTSWPNLLDFLAIMKLLYFSEEP